MSTSPDRIRLEVAEHSSLDAALAAPGENPGPRLLQALRNPYYPGRPIDSRECFYGRTYEVRTALSLLAKLQSISLIGPRRIGKTSLLHYFSVRAVLKYHAVDPKQFVFIFMSCAELSDLSRDRILQLMFDQALDRVKQAGFRVDSGGPPAAMTFFDFSSSPRRLTEFGGRLVFLLDEFEYMAQNRSLDPAFVAGLRSIASNLSVACVTASRVRLLDLTCVDSSVLESPFFGNSAAIRLGLLDDSGAHELITRPSRAAGMAFSDATEELRALLVAANVSGQISVNGTPYSLDTLGEVDNEFEAAMRLTIVRGQMAVRFSCANRSTGAQPRL